MNRPEGNAPEGIFYRKLFPFDVILYTENEDIKIIFKYKYTK